jgi:hypothetical protein
MLQVKNHGGDLQVEVLLLSEVRGTLLSHKPFIARRKRAGNSA